jgi:uncharacterized protein YuzE
MEEFKAIYDENEDWLFLAKVGDDILVDDREIGKGIFAWVNEADEIALIEISNASRLLVSTPYIAE